MKQYTLDQVVREHLIELGESNENKYYRLLQMAISGLREMHMDYSGVIKATLLPVSENLTVDLPNDYLRYIKIALVDAAGNIQELGLNSSMALQRSYDSCGNTVTTIPETGQSVGVAWGWGFGWEGYADNYRNGECTGRFFGMGGGNNRNGYYRIDEDRNVIQLASTSATQIMLEYLSDLTLIDGEFRVHPFLLETLKAWMYWKWIQRNSSKTLGEKSQAKTDYYDEKNRSVRRYNAQTMQEWLAAFRLSSQASPKF